MHVNLHTQKTRMTATVSASAVGNKRSYSRASLYQVTALEYKFQPIFNPYNQHYKTGKYENAYTGVYTTLLDGQTNIICTSPACKNSVISPYFAYLHNNKLPHNVWLYLTRSFQLFHENNTCWHDDVICRHDWRNVHVNNQRFTSHLQKPITHTGCIFYGYSVVCSAPNLLL